MLTLPFETFVNGTPNPGPSRAGQRQASPELPLRGQTRRDFCRAVVASLPLALAGSRPARSLGSGDGGGVLLYSGWATKNIGDIGHTPGTLRYLEDYCPGIPVTLWLRTSNEAVDQMLRRRFPQVPIVRGTLDGAGQADDPDLQSAFNRCRMLLHNSGMHYNSFWPPPEHLVTACLAHHKEIGLYGQSFDGFAPEDEDRLVSLLSRTSFIYTRDVESLVYLRRAGVSPPILEFGPDGCFGIDVRDDAAATRFLDVHGLQPRKFITVTLRSGARVRDKSTDDAELGERWASRLREVVTDWVRETGMRVLLAPEVEKEIEAARRLILERLPSDVRAEVVLRETFWSVDEAASVYDRAHTVVSMEPHSCIIALAFGTPAIHFYSLLHGVKAWMFRDIGLPEWLISIDEDRAADVVSALKAIDSDYARATEKVRRAMAFVDRRSGEMMATVRAVVGTPASA
jgi:polysaccharide pyruvyl transferase WcaK-like protein